MAITTATVDRLLEKNGRDVIYRKFSEIPDDPAKPWLGTTVVETSVTAITVEGDPGFEEFSEGLTDVQRGERIFFTRSDTDLDGFHEVRDGVDTYKILHTKRLKPGDIIFLYEIRVGR